MNKEEEDEDAFIEPQVTSADPNERKLARTLRIERRLESIRKQQQQAEGDEVIQDEENNFVQQQLQQSMELLEKLINEGDEQITNVRVANDMREVDRRELEGIGRKKVIAKIEEEANNAEEAFNEIADRWADIKEYNDPLFINDELMNQKDKCDEMIRQKDGIIAMIKEQLKIAEINFNADQRRQEDDITILTKRIEKQMVFMRKAFRTEIELLENAILQERKVLLDAKEKKWDELYKKRDQQEIDNKDRKYQQIEYWNDKMRDLRIDFEEKYRETKISVNNDISDIHQELERIKSVSLLNSEKLDYNYQIYKKREDENIIIKSQQKRRINKLQDIINSLQSKISDYQKFRDSSIEKLSNEIKKLHRSIIDIETKADHFATVNTSQYLQVWKMNESRAKNLIKKIMNVDQILHEQQLGLIWEPPKKLNLDIKNLPTYKMAIKAIIRGDMDTPSEVDKKVSTTITPKSRRAKSCIDHDVSKFGKDSITYRNLTRHIISKIAGKTGFLVEEKLNDILQPYKDSESTLIKMDNVYAALNIKEAGELELLMEVFFPYVECPICAVKEKNDDALPGHMSETMIDQESSESTVGDTKLEDATFAAFPCAEILEDVVAIFVDKNNDNTSDDPTPSVDIEPEGECAGPKALKDSADFEAEKSQVTFSTVSSEKPVTETKHPLVIKTEFVLKALRIFLVKYFTGKDDLITMRERLTRKRNTISRLISTEDMQNFWGALKNAYTPEMKQLWHGLYEGLTKYNEILKERKTLCNEVIFLRKQNEELTDILEKYIERQTIKSKKKK